MPAYWAFYLDTNFKVTRGGRRNELQEERRARRNAHARPRITRCAPLFERCIKFAFDRRGSRVIRDWIFHRRVIEDYALPSAGHLSFLVNHSWNFYSDRGATLRKGDGHTKRTLRLRLTTRDSRDYREESILIFSWFFFFQKIFGVFVYIYIFCLYIFLLYFFFISFLVSTV